MIVRRMSALSHPFCNILGGNAARKCRKNGAYREALFSPKAKVGCSNHLGRANKINSLRRLFRRRAKGKLTTNSPTERAYWSEIGGRFATLLP
jgi:hypothetical protein